MTGSGGDNRCRDALAETWGALAEVCFELSDDRVGAAHRVPRLGRQGSALAPHRDRAGDHGRAGSRVGRAPRRPRQERLRRHQRALRRRAAGAARAGRAGGVRRGDRDPAGPAGRADGGGMGRTGMEPGGRGAARGVHDGAGLRQLGARAGCSSRPRPSGRVRERGLGHLAGPRPGRHALRRRQAGGVRRRHRRPLRRRRSRGTTRAPSRSPSRAGAPERSATRWRRR